MTHDRVPLLAVAMSLVVAALAVAVAALLLLQDTGWRHVALAAYVAVPPLVFLARGAGRSVLP